MVSAPTLDLSACEREPIHAPGAIQPHGAFLAAELETFTITHASTNLAALIGRNPHDVIGQNLETILGASATAALAASLQPGGPPSCHWESRPGGFPTLRLHGFATGLPPAGGGHGDLLGVDLEPLPDTQATPLYAVQALAEVLKSATTATELCDITVRRLRGLTGYDRVVAYRFHADGHGEVIAESRAAHAESFLGLRYPASDVPPQAHALYLRKLVAAIADAGAAPAAILAAPSHPAALDLTLSDLRAVSPLHLQYMRNMGTAAALRIGLPDEDRLWGLILCHHLTPRLPGPGQRAAAALIGQIAALKLRNLGAAAIRAQHASREALLAAIARRLAEPERFAQLLPSIETELLGLVGASGALVYHNYEAFLIGMTPPEAACLRMLASLRSEAPGELSIHDDLSLHHPEFADCAAAASGALLLPITIGEANAILWFRPEQARSVMWGGNPAEHAIRDEDTGQLGPRRSFAAWQETMRGRSQPWSELDVAMAKEYRSAYAAAAARNLKTQLVRLRDYDALTGLPNWARLQQWLGEPGRHSAARIGLLAIDLGDLGDLTARLGQEGISALLVELAQRLLPIAGEDSLAARHGAAEFIVLFLGLGPAELKARAVYVRDAIELPYHIHGQAIRIAPAYRCTYADEAEGRDLGGAAGLALASAKAASAFKRQVDTQRQKMEGLGRMMGGIAHEINNMLQPVTLLGQDLLDRAVLADDAAETLGIMLDCTRQACHIIGDVLAFSRPKRRGAERLDPGELLREKLRLVRQSIPGGLTLVADIQDGLPAIMANRTTFAQILVNLATNAAAAMGAEGTLTITLADAADSARDTVFGGPGRFLRLCVIDTGAGMDQQTMDRAFEPFFTTKPVGVGTGLGLPVVFGLVEEMSGTITLASQPGAGTTVTILLPYAPDLASGQSPAAG